MAAHKKAALNKMDKDELLAIASSMLKSEIPSGDVTREELVDLILDMQESQNVAPEQPETTAKAPQSAKKYKLVIHEQDGVGGLDDVPVSINGYAYNIKRNHEVVVPETVISVLKDAVMTLFERDEKTGEIRERTIKRFAFSCEPV